MRNGALGFVGATQDLPTYTQGGGELVVFAIPRQEAAARRRRSTILSARSNAAMRSLLIASVVLVLGAPAVRAQPDGTSPTGQPMQPEASPRSVWGVLRSRPLRARALPSPPRQIRSFMCRCPASTREMSRSRKRSTIPSAKDPQATTRGMQDFIQFNCVGCHAPNAGGGMGPALSEGQSVYGSTPANLFLSIYQGRPNGMPAWGELLPKSTIWELVAYVQSIAHPPTGASDGRSRERRHRPRSSRRLRVLADRKALELHDFLHRRQKARRRVRRCAA